MNKIVYTSIDNFKLKNWKVLSYKELSENFVSWIEETTIKLIQDRSPAESKALEQLKVKSDCIYEQPFFMLRGRSYFLDFYLPRYKLAIEIDGKTHKNRILEDKQRDSDFREIGIKTIRVKAKDVFSGIFMEVVASKLKTKKTKRTTKNKNKIANKESRLICAARKRLREHDRNKYRASWV